MSDVNQEFIVKDLPGQMTATLLLLLHLHLPPARPFCVERKKVKCEIKIRDERQEL